MRIVGRPIAAKAAAALGVAGLVLSPAFAAGEQKRRAPAISFTVEPAMSFTPAAADPRLAASLNRGAPSLADFKFTPAAAKGRPSQVRVAVRARATSPVLASANTSASPVSALAPVTYNLGAAVGWRRFAVAGEVGKVEAAGAPVDSREKAMVGVSYSLPRFTGRVAVSADRSEQRAVAPLRDPDNYAVDVGGSYSLSKRVAVTGGVRYKIERDRLSALKDDRVDSQAVYVGTAFKF